VLLAEQDSSLWDRAQIVAGRAELDRALALRGPGPSGTYILQAAIAALHATEPRDWIQIAALYGELARVTGSAVVELNRAAAIAEADGPEAGLRAIEALRSHPAGPGALEGYHYLHAARAELLRRLERHEDASDAYRQALALVRIEPERRLLERRLSELGDSFRREGR
jgi:RNA polymerase sigma-70 factor, ECF subfamily